MRVRVFALLLAAIGLAAIPAAAEAGHRRHHHHHGEYNLRGWAESYEPYYHRHYRSDWEYDRYDYYPTRRGYYPSYNSGYWRPTIELQYRKRYYRPYSALPPYYQAWGYPKRYGYRKWDSRHHHRRW